MTSFRRRAMFVIAALLLSVAGLAVPAHAHENATWYWENNDNTGGCGVTSGGYVVAAQTVLYVWGSYTSTVDGYWGTATRNATINYQSAHGLAADGCIGPNTWANMFARTYYDGYETCGSSGVGIWDYRYDRSGRYSDWLRSANSGLWYAMHLYPMPRSSQLSGYNNSTRFSHTFPQTAC